MILYQIDTRYVFIRTNGRLGKKTKYTFLFERMDVWVKRQNNEKSSRRRETTPARSPPVLAGSGGASNVKHVQQSAHREVDLISI